MKTMPRVVTTLLLLTVALLSGCASQSAFQSVSDSGEIFEVGTISFRSPPGDGWSYLGDSDDPAEFVLFLKRGDLDTPGFGASVGQIRADDPVTSHKQLRDYVLSPLRDAIDFQEPFQIRVTECQPDDRFAEIGVNCLIEGRHHLQGFFWIDGMNRGDLVTVKGHGYAFVSPGDDRVVTVIDYYQGGLPDKLLDDTHTQTQLDEFARGVKY